MGGPSGAHDPVTSVRGAVGPSTKTAWKHFPARLRQEGSGGRGQGRLSPSRKGWVWGGSLLRGAFRRTVQRTNRKLRLQVTSETGLFLPRQGSHPDRKRTGRSPRALVAPPLLLRPRPRRSHRPSPHPQAGHAQWAGPGRAGRFAWSSAVAGAGSTRRRHVPLLRLVPGKLRTKASPEEPAGGLRAAVAAAAQRRPSGGPTCPRLGCGRSARKEAPAGRTPRGAPGGAGAARTFVRVQSPPCGLGLSGAPAPAPLAPGRCLSGPRREEPAAGGGESRVRGSLRGAGETRCPPGPRPPRTQQWRKQLYGNNTR